MLLLVSAPATSAPCTVRVLTRSLYTENGAVLALRWYTAVVRSIQQDTARALQDQCLAAPDRTPRLAVKYTLAGSASTSSGQSSVCKGSINANVGFWGYAPALSNRDGKRAARGEGPAQQNAPYGGLFPLNAPASAAGLFRSLLTGQRAHAQPRFPAGQPPNPSEPAYSTRNCGRSFPHSFTKHQADESSHTAKDSLVGLGLAG